MWLLATAAPGFVMVESCMAAGIGMISRMPAASWPPGESIVEAISHAWVALSAAQGDRPNRLMLLELEAAYSAATGKNMPSKVEMPMEVIRNSPTLYPVSAGPYALEPIDDIRRGLGLAPKFGHLSGIEVKMFTRQMDEAAGRKYDESEPIADQAKRLAAQIRRDIADLENGSNQLADLAKLAEELEVGYVVDTGMGALSEVDQVTGAIPKGSSAGSFTLPPAPPPKRSDKK